MKVVQLPNPYAASLELQLNRVSKGLQKSPGTRKYVSSNENGGLILSLFCECLCTSTIESLAFFLRAFTIKIIIGMPVIFF